MFGTLVICLPSEHTGGAVCLKHGEKSARFDTSETSIFDATFIAWFVFNNDRFVFQRLTASIGIPMLFMRLVNHEIFKRAPWID